MLPESADALDPIDAFAQQLGIRPDEDAEFGWLAEVGLQSPLPPRWTSHADASTGYVFYVDHDRQVSSWENPLVPYLRRIVEIGRAYLEKRSEEFFEEQKGLLWHQHKHDLDCWHGPFADAEGRNYYVNSTAGVSSWQDPRVDTQYIFELESGLLATLAEVLPPPEPDTPGWGENGFEKTGSGAEVLTLEENLHDSTPTKAASGDVLDRGLSRRLTQTMVDWHRNNNRDEHKSVLEKMAQQVDWVRTAQKDEQEVQKLTFQRKVEERKKRLLHEKRRAARVARLSPAGAFSAQPLTPMPLPPMPEMQTVSSSLAGRPAPRPLLDDPSGLDTPAASPMPSPGGATPAGTPFGSPMPSPANAAPQPPFFSQPAPPPPEPGATSPTMQAQSSGSQSCKAQDPKAPKARTQSRLFAQLAAAAPAQPRAAA